MSMMANSEATQAMRIRAEDVLERKGTSASRQAGALAGQFAAMLETLNGVGEAGASGADGTGVVPNAQPSVRLGVGAVTLFAQEDGQGDAAMDPAAAVPDPQDPATAMQVVESAIQAGDGSNFRWLTTLLTQNSAA
ncbi:hypothetical protein HUE56_27430 (plasmid) [Azospirillum oryzae]|uniref:Uncharacterized protein n=1 Tax=Azospirillum oryzae TaxID=286727 RepID=A0A6N1ASA0_9PROT|nr:MULTISPECIES: hypothetical protein [Azospirillum]KAA0570716.1 hypothetical protein FZ029_29365 [Azospirillum sp. Sh1]KAA0586933.1 hypothetical protein FZ938_19395 [Azospirillum oryzae]QKS54203.1 hypothetical protein HUE56_27430 [Azospirillum oryzae]GLR80182.1 hypothetical protein GCM10007856_28600 [Azospirillum oryzae]